MKYKSLIILVLLLTSCSWFKRPKPEPEPDPCIIYDTIPVYYPGLKEAQELLDSAEYIRNYLEAWSDYLIEQTNAHNEAVEREDARFDSLAKYWNWYFDEVEDSLLFWRSATESYLDSIHESMTKDIQFQVRHWDSIILGRRDTLNQFHLWLIHYADSLEDWSRILDSMKNSKIYNNLLIRGDTLGNVTIEWDSLNRPIIRRNENN